MTRNTESNADKPWNRVEAPTVERDTTFGDKHTHPAFGAISASRLSGGGDANLFGSNVGHTGFVKIEVHEAHMYRDGYSEKIHGMGKSYIEVWLSEAQWVAFVSRMNVGSGTPCTIRHYGTGEGIVHCPRIANPEKAAERMGSRIDELQAENLRKVDARAAALEALCEGLPVKKRDAILKELGLLTGNLKRNHEYAATTLREYKEQLVTESKIEMDAMVTDVVSRLGLESVQQLGHLLAADPAKAMKLLADESEG